MAIEQDILVRTLVAERAKLLGFIRSIVRSREMAEDIFQDVCVLAIEKRHEIQDEQHLLAWSRVAARLHALNLLRRKQNRQQVLDEAVLDLLETNWRRHDSDNSYRLIELVRQCMSRLSDKARSLVHHRYVEGVDVHELARRVNRPVNSLYVTFSRIHAALADCVHRKVLRGEVEHG